MGKIETVTEKVRESTFVYIRNKLQSKFNGLTEGRNQREAQAPSLVKPAVINLTTT